MLRRILLTTAIATAGLVSAQDSGSSTVKPSTTSSSSPTITSTSALTTHSIAVGADGFKFTPNEVKNASVGDIIEFRFYPGGHTVVRSEFEFPCIPYEMTGANKVGFYSGQRSPQVISNDPPAFQVQVNNTDPIFFYCSAPGSCYQQHMIGVINPNGTETLEKQMEYAMNATGQLSPGDPFPSETANPTKATQSATSSPSSSGGNTSDNNGNGSSLSSGAIAGIAIGGAAVLVLAGALIYLCGRRGGFVTAYRRSASTFPSPLVESKFGPKSPGQETFSTQHYSAQSGIQQGHYAPSSGLGSPGFQPQYYSHPVQGPHSPPMGGMDGQAAYFAAQPSPPAQPVSPPPAPVELPSSDNPGNSPLPQYKSNRHFSWSRGSEGHYRPADKP